MSSGMRCSIWSWNKHLMTLIGVYQSSTRLAEHLLKSISTHECSHLVHFSPSTWQCSSLHQNFSSYMRFSWWNCIVHTRPFLWESVMHYVLRYPIRTRRHYLHLLPFEINVVNNFRSYLFFGAPLHESPNHSHLQRCFQVFLFLGCRFLRYVSFFVFDPFVYSLLCWSFLTWWWILW